ncbi:MAG: hypothetical protein AB7G21_13205 [Dehalococcoidia bacterium]
MATQDEDASSAADVDLLSGGGLFAGPTFSEQRRENRRDLVEKTSAWMAAGLTLTFILFIAADIAFWVFGDADHAADMLRDVASVLGPLLGTVLGYYFSTQSRS